MSDDVRGFPPLRWKKGARTGHDASFAMKAEWKILG
jgi:hypothetical protein